MIEKDPTITHIEGDSTALLAYLFLVSFIVSFVTNVKKKIKEKIVKYEKSDKKW